MIEWSVLTPTEKITLVAEKVMGFSNTEGFDPWNHPWDVDLVVNRIKADSVYAYHYDHWLPRVHYSQITPDDICLAALKAVGVEVY